MMNINKNVYPIDWDGPLGTVECSKCGIKLDIDEEAMQDDVNNQFYCESCHKELLQEKEEENE